MARAAGRTLAAAALPAVAVAVSWIRLEDPRRPRELALVVLLAVAPALVRAGATRLAAVALSVVATAWIAFGAELWELLPFRDERVAGPVSEQVWLGLGGYYDVVLRFDPALQPEMHALLLVAVFGFVSAIALLVAIRRPLAAAAVTIAGAGWPATLLGGGAVATGALALAAALSIALVLRSRSVRTLAIGALVAALVVAGAASVSSATSFTREAFIDWQTWELGGPAASARGVRFVWDAQYDGIRFPSTKTEVLRISGVERAQYWRASTLDRFGADRWFETDLGFVVTRGKATDATGPLALDELAPAAARDETRWLEQRVQLKALVDDRVVAAGTPVALDAPELRSVFTYSGGIVRALRTMPPGSGYRVWSYVPDPTPAELAALPARYPAAAAPFLTLWNRTVPAFGKPGRDHVVSGLLGSSAYPELGVYRPVYTLARQVTHGAKSPYAAVLALESWFRRGGGFRYEEQPPVADLPLVQFVTSTRAGYCQHFAGAMALMSRMLGIPARVAVGFTSGKRVDGGWSVSDHDAHAWVEVWFPGQGWVPFDPTPGRGTFSTSYSFASDSAETLDALRRGALGKVVAGEDAGDLLGDTLTPRTSSGGGERPSIVTIVIVLIVAGALCIGLAKWLGRRLRYLTVDPRRVAAASRKELEAFLRDQGVAVRPSATLDDLRAAVGDELGFDASAFVRAAGRARFGPLRDAPNAARNARKELQALLRIVRSELSIRARLRGFVSLRSLRGRQG